jgi:hypothetical protein
VAEFRNFKPLFTFVRLAALSPLLFWILYFALRAMSDDTNDDFFIGPMPTTDQVTSILTTTEDMETSPPVDGYGDDQHDKPEEDDDNERTTVLMIHDKDDSFKLNSESINDDDSNSPDNRPPSPQPLFLRSGIGASLDGLEYDGVISQIAETNEVDKPWLELKVIIRSALLDVSKR